MPIRQDVNDVRLTVSSNRVIPYGPQPARLSRAMGDIPTAVIEGMSSPTVDSPVRDSSDMLTAPRRDWVRLQNEIVELKAALRRSVGLRDDSAEAWTELGVAPGKDEQLLEATSSLGGRPARETRNSGVEEGLAEVTRTIESIEPGRRSCSLSAAMEVWQDLMASGVLDARSTAGSGRALQLGSASIEDVTPPQSSTAKPGAATSIGPA